MSESETGAPIPEGGDPPENMPDFSQVVQTFAIQALMACGKVANPITDESGTDLRLARYHIGVLEVLKDKTAGNLSDREERLLDAALHQARMACIEVAGQSDAQRAESEKGETEKDP